MYLDPVWCLMCKNHNFAFVQTLMKFNPCIPVISIIKNNMKVPWMGIVSSACHDLMLIRNMIFCTVVVISNQIQKIHEHQGKASAFYGCFEHLRVLSPEISRDYRVYDYRINTGFQDPRGSTKNFDTAYLICISKINKAQNTQIARFLVMQLKN